MLKAYGDGYVLPENVPANEFLNLEGDKISTSRNWAIWLEEYLDQFPSQQDVMRYVLCANAPETKDNDFTWKDFQARNNSELVAIYGNFVNRALVLTNKYFQGSVPGYTEDQLTEEDKKLIASVPEIVANLNNCLEHFKFRDAVKEAMNLARLGNKYLTDTEPWKVYKTDPQRVAVILNLCLQICANLSIAFEPFCPFSSKKLQAMLGLIQKKDEVCPKSVPEGIIRWENLGKMDLMKEGSTIGTPELLFSKIEDETIQAQTNRLAAIKKANQEKEAAEEASHPEPLAPECTIDDFAKMDIRTATVLQAEAVPKTDKLLKLTIDTGVDQRVIVSGIAEYYTPEDMLGKQICILSNLKPRKIRGIESNGMILMAKDRSGKMRFITPQEVMPNGAKIG